MPDSFVCPVVHIDKERFPVSPQCVIIHCVAVILGGDKTLLRPHHTHRLVMAAVAILQFIDRSTACFGKQLVSHANATDRFVPIQCLADIPDSNIASIRIARAVRKEKPIVFQMIEIIVPGNTYHRYIPLQKVTDDIGFHTTIEKHNTLQELRVES